MGDTFTPGAMQFAFIPENMNPSIIVAGAGRNAGFMRSVMQPNIAHRPNTTRSATPTKVGTVSIQTPQLGGN